ncbi:hypothetical protein GDO81_009023 [Engystomops pustulosus]|uniref:DSN1 n=1 Tax=Engystomops pustulosus TaxID=76066 RepID=A0AAV7BNH1_ENGPU|nr:hypothetical protein GDO81_009023 [Engystomops pustulosus]
MEATSNVTPPRSSPRKLLSTPPRTAAAPSPDKRQKNSPNNLSFKETSPSPRQRRRSLRRSVGKKHRRTLPPIYHNPTELSEAISSELPESERLSALLHSCFEFSLRNLENSLSRVDGFSSESFQLSAFCILRFTTESSRWEELLEEYKEKAVVLTKKLEESKVSSNPLPDVPDVASSQDQVLRSKPDYSAIVQQQGAVFDCMEIVMDNIQQSIGFLNSFLDDRTSHLQQLSTQLKSQSFKPMEDSPVRTFLKVYKK